MTQTLWFLTRSSGVVALALMVAAVIGGLVFSGREAGRKRLKPAWWLDLHRGLGGYALAFTGVHMICALGAGIGVHVTDMFVPNASRDATAAFTLGVLAFYALLLTTFTTWPKRLLPRKVWHAIHLLTIPALVLAFFHSYLLGTDAKSSWFSGVLLALVASVMYPAGLRVSGMVRRRRQQLDTTPVEPDLWQQAILRTRKGS